MFRQITSNNQGKGSSVMGLRVGGGVGVVAGTSATISLTSSIMTRTVTFETKEYLQNYKYVTKCICCEPDEEPDDAIAKVRA